ncbi:MAG: PAS domain S-box protein [Candidatus Zixiibacteriota bacterium]
MTEINIQNDFLSNIFDTFKEGIAVIDKNRRIVYMNQAAQKQLPSFNTDDIFNYDAFLLYRHTFDIIRTDNGQLLEISKSPYLDEEFTIITLRDITKLERLTESRENALELLIELDSDFLFELEINRGGAVYLKWASPDFFEITGYKPLEINAFDENNNLICKKDIRIFLGILDRIKDGLEESIEIRILTKDNRNIWIKFAFVPIFSKKQDRYTSIFGSGRVVLDKVPEDMDSSKNGNDLSTLIRSAFTNMVDAIFITDLEGMILFANKSASRITGKKREYLSGRYIDDLLNIKDIDKSEAIDWKKLFADKKLQAEISDLNLFVSSGLRKNSYSNLFISSIIDNDGVQLGLMFQFHDIYRKIHQKREKQARERLESISLLSGGLAHDFNNILMGIIGNLDLAKMLTSERDVKERLDKADDSIQRAKQLTKQLQTLAKGRKPWKKAIDVRELLNNTVRFALSGTTINPVFRIAKDIYDIDADEYLINEALNELIRNSVEAMPEGGNMIINAQNTIVDDIDGLPLNPGKYVLIKIKDSGKGIENNVLMKIINPYFSTKPGSMGMGLPTTHSIIISHNGHLKLESELGKGTMVSIYLPASINIIKEKNERVEEEKFGKNILLIDDEIMVREVAGKMLKKLGYKVAYACDLKSSVEEFEKAIANKSPFDGVIIDLVINGQKGGINIIKRLLEIDPNIKAILSSGYSNDPVIINYYKYGFNAVMLKPYTTMELKEVLKNAFHSDKNNDRNNSRTR